MPYPEYKDWTSVLKVLLPKGYELLVAYCGDIRGLEWLLKSRKLCSGSEGQRFRGMFLGKYIKNTSFFEHLRFLHVKRLAAGSV